MSCIYPSLVYTLTFLNHVRLSQSHLHLPSAINVSTCTSLWTGISGTVAVDSSLAWLVPLSLCGWPQACSRAAVLPPPHAEQTQTTAASLLTWHPARPRHARGICSAHARKYGGPITHTHTFAFRHEHIMIYRCRYSGQSGQDAWVRNIHGWQKNSLHCCGWINQKCHPPNGFDLVGNSLN